MRANKYKIKRTRRLISPLTIRILAVNLIALIFLGGGVLYVDQVQNTLMQSRIDELIKDAEFMAGALGETATDDPDTTELLIEPAKNILIRLVNITKLRTRYFAINNELMIDSRDLNINNVVVENTMPKKLGIRDFWEIINREVYLVLDKIQNNREGLEIYHELEDEMATDYPEVLTALAGEVSSRVRRLDDQRDIITVAVPVQRFRRVLGALMLSTDTGDIYASVQDVRLTIIQIFCVSLLITLLLSLFLAKTIVRPILKLAHSADNISLGEKSNIPDLSSRNDEIGDLSRSLKDMTEILARQIDAVASFAADVAHELKNPLTSMRSAIETMEYAKTEENRQKLRAIISDDVKRLDRLITDISDVSRLDAEMSHSMMQQVNLTALLETMIDIYLTTQKDNLPHLHLDIKQRRFKLRDGNSAPYFVLGLEGQLGQVIRNLVDNAISFSRKDGNIWIRMKRRNNMVEILVEDEGIGIPEDKLENIFDRFYSERPKGEAFGKHSGLGLNICKQVVEAHGGEIYAENRMDDEKNIIGARFVVLLPLADN
ncbi:MAG: sensor N-terminal transmembrane domain-containing protein [Alphaproteobacteria bacterium]|nr:sensor N-terminal transmembrane domain-containing protein [Alphaproteobacteria bacterium]HPF47320.1 stimulus-sensing domain-containing protein [Emcibacteraceae bacterium]HRW28968.1 stimulus-sensing domain-containing protein [Emcibacteraceae bacterium]